MWAWLLPLLGKAGIWLLERFTGTTPEHQTVDLGEAEATSRVAQAEAQAPRDTAGIDKRLSDGNF